MFDEFNIFQVEKCQTQTFQYAHGSPSRLDNGLSCLLSKYQFYFSTISKYYVYNAIRMADLMGVR